MQPYDLIIIANQLKTIIWGIQCLLQTLDWDIMLQPYFEGVWGWNSHFQIGTWESPGIPETLKFDCRGQNTLHWGVLYIIRKLSKFKYRKWARMGHLDISSTSYGKKKGRESNWQFDSRPLKVGNRLDPDVCKSSVTHRWKALEKITSLL
jgi:hypothetical protein